jgi:hypothetical protein
VASDQRVEVVAAVQERRLQLSKRAHTPSDYAAASNTRPNFTLSYGCNGHASAVIWCCAAEQKRTGVSIPHSDIAVIISSPDLSRFLRSS